MEALIPILNENDRVKVGKGWVITLKYVLPIILFIMWLSGVSSLIATSNSFEMAIYGVITVVILVLSYVFTNIRE